MAITTYDELKTAVQAWFYERTDLSSYVADFIALAEGHFNRELRLREMVAVTDLTPTSGVVTLPTDYLGYKRVVEKASSRRALSYITPEAADRLYSTSSAGLAINFTIVGSSLYTYPSASNDVELTYFQKIPALSDANTSNWLLAKYPNVYLRGALMMMAEFDKDDAEQSKQTQMLDMLLRQLRAEDDTAQYYGAEYTAIEVTP